MGALRARGRQDPERVGRPVPVVVALSQGALTLGRCCKVGVTLEPLQLAVLRERNRLDTALY